MIKIISFVDSFKHYNEPILEFLKRLWKDIEFIKLKPSKRKEIPEIVLDETLQLEKILEKEKWYIILLFIDSKELNTLEFAKLIEEKKAKYSNIIFVIGWAYWVLEEKLEKYIDIKLSLSPMTFTHIEAIMILLEQIYRIHCIKKGTKYHH